MPRRRWTQRQESMAKARVVQQLMFLANGFVATQGVELASNADGAMPGTTSRTKLLAAGTVDPKSTAKRSVR